MNPTPTLQFKFDGEIIETVDVDPSVPCPQPGHYARLDKSYHVIDVGHDYSSLDDDNEADEIKINVILAEHL